MPSLLADVSRSFIMDQSKSIAKKMKKNLDYKNIDYLMKSIECFFFKQKTAYEISLGLVGSEMCIRDRL